MAENPSGIKFPFTFSGAGGVRTVSGAEKVASNLEALVKTAINERIVRKNVGTIGYKAVLRNADEVARKAIKDFVREAIVKHEPRALLLSLDISSVEMTSGIGVFIDGNFIFRQTGEEATFRSQIA